MRQPISDKIGRSYWMRVTIILPFLLTFVSLVQGQGSKEILGAPINQPMTLFYVVAVLLVITMLLVVVVAMYMLRVFRMFVDQAMREKAEKAGLQYIPALSWLERTWDSMNASVPLSKEKDIDLGHEYDGIRELDNHLPPWWKGLFYGCVIWGIGYMVVYHFTYSFPLSAGEYENELVTAAEELRILRASQPLEVIDENALIFTHDAGIIASGKKVFISNNCGSCHREDGGGNAIGPNLADSYWIHGGTIKDVFTTIKIGVVQKGMPAWGKVMSPGHVRDVAFFVMSLQGSKPESPKKPEGNLVEPGDIQMPADSTKGVANQ